MKKIILIFLLCFSTYASSQSEQVVSNEDVRKINMSSLELVEDYENYSRFIYKSRQNKKLQKIFTKDAVVFNDLVTSENFTMSEQEYNEYIREFYIKLTKGNNMVKYQVDVPVIFLSSISGDREKGSLYVIVEKNLSVQLEDASISIKDMHVDLNDDGLGDTIMSVSEPINYQFFGDQAFRLRLNIDYQLGQDGQYNTFISSIEAEKKYRKPNIYVFYEKNIGQSPFPITRYNLNLLSNESADELVLNGNSIKYLVADDLESKIRYNNPSFRKNFRKPKKQEDPELGFQQIVFKEKIMSSFYYNYAIVSNSNILGFNDYYTSNSLSDVQLIVPGVDNIINIVSSCKDVGFSFSTYPFKFKNKSNSLSISLGVKLNTNFSTIDFNSDLIDFWYMDFDLDNLPYARHIKLSLFNESVDVNSQSCLLSFKLSYNGNQSSNDNISFSPFLGLNVPVFHLLSAKYVSSGDGRISGKYPQYFDVEVTDLLNDYGAFSFYSSSDLNSQNTFFNMNLSELLIGADVMYKNIGLGVAFNQQVGTWVLFDSVENDMLLTSENDVNSITDVISGLELKNRYITFSLNLKF